MFYLLFSSIRNSVSTFDNPTSWQILGTQRFYFENMDGKMNPPSPRTTRKILREKRKRMLLPTAPPTQRRKRNAPTPPEPVDITNENLVIIFSVEHAYPFNATIHGIPVTIIFSRPNFLQLHVLLHHGPFNTDNPIKLSVIRQRLWDMFANWLSDGFIRSVLDEEELQELYLFALETNMPALQNDCMTVIMTWYRIQNHLPSWGELAYGSAAKELFKKPSSKLCLFYQRVYHFLANTYPIYIAGKQYRIPGHAPNLSTPSGKRWLAERSRLQELKRLCRAGELYNDVPDAKAMEGIGQNDPRNVGRETICEYHVHESVDEMEKCKKSAQVGGLVATAFGPGKIKR